MRMEELEDFDTSDLIEELSYRSLTSFELDELKDLIDDDETTIDDFDTDELIDELEDRNNGSFKFFNCTNLADEQKYELIMSYFDKYSYEELEKRLK